MNIDVTLRLFSKKWHLVIDRRWIQFGIIASTVLVSVLVSYWGSTTILVLFPILIGGIAVFLVLIRWINVGFILVLLASMFIPWRGPGGINASVIMVAVVIGLWLLDMLVVKRSLRFLDDRVLLPVVLFFISSIISFVMGQIPWFSFANQAPMDAQVGGFTIFLLSFGIMIATAHLIQDVQWIKIIVWAFIGLGAIFVVGRSLNLPVGRLYQYGFTAGSMFWTWLVALSFSQLIFNNALKKIQKFLLLLLVFAAFYVAFVLGYDWKSGWVPPLVAVVVILGLRYPRLVVVTVPVALVVAGYVIIQLIGSDEYSWGTRVDAWLIVLEISKESPLFGLGFSNYYWYTPLFPIRGWYVNFNSHSQFVDLIAQVGLVGLFLFLWVYYEMGKLSWALLGKLQDGFEKSYAYGVLGGVIGTLVAAFLVDWVLPFVYNIGLNGFRASVLPWIFCGGLISLKQIYNKRLKPNS